jgi:SAM-dependent methyltransferase
MTDFVRDLQTRLLDGLVRGGAQNALQVRAEFFTSLFENELPPQSDILDIGGRWGFYSGPLIKRGHQPIVLDVVRPGFQKAPVVIYDGSKMPFEDKSFDASILVTVLHHIRDQVSVLQEARRVTRKRIVIVEDLYHHPLGRFWTIFRDRLLNFEWFGHPCGFRTRPQWEIFFKEQGFQVRDCRQVDTWLCGLQILNGVFILDVQ